MVYIKLFQTEQEKQACTDTYEYLSYTIESDKVNIHEEVHDYSKDYLTFVALSDGTFKFSGQTQGGASNCAISYSTDNGSTWSVPSQTVEINVQSGDKVKWKGEMNPGTYGPNDWCGIGVFSGGTATFDAEGNPMSLLFGDNYASQTSLSGKNYAFCRLFINTKCVNANNLTLLATTLAISCYDSIFSGCTSLTTAPQLLATTLDSRCYYSMFQGCTSLTTAPQLPATTLASSCYYSMFASCTSLTTAPELPATTLTNYCYQGMFSGCTSLTKAPQISATTLDSGCCISMFSNCTSLTQAPQLLATSLAIQCYQNMFSGCTNLNYIKMLATNISAAYCLSSWVSGVAASGTFVKAAEMTTLPSGDSGIPSNWTVQDA